MFGPVGVCLCVCVTGVRIWMKRLCVGVSVVWCGVVKFFGGVGEMVNGCGDPTVDGWWSRHCVVVVKAKE